MKDDLWPLTIIADRYSGAYSDGQYLAFPLNYDGIPKFIGGDNVDESMGWENWDHVKCPVGTGRTPIEAYENLKQKLKDLKPAAITSEKIGET